MNLNKFMVDSEAYWIVPFNIFLCVYGFSLGACAGWYNSVAIFVVAIIPPILWLLFSGFQIWLWGRKL